MDVIKPEIETVKVRILPDGRMDVPNASTYLGMSTGSLNMMRCKGNGPAFVKVVGKVFYYRDDLDAWLKSGYVYTTDQPKNDQET